MKPYASWRARPAAPNGADRQVLQRVRSGGFLGGEACRIQTGDGAVRRCGAFDGHRGVGRSGATARDHGRPLRPLGRGGETIRRTVDKFTGDGIMAVSAPRSRWRTTRFGHAWRRWRCRLSPPSLADESPDHDDIDLQLRIGLNSGQVIAGEIGTAAATAARDLWSPSSYSPESARADSSAKRWRTRRVAAYLSSPRIASPTPPTSLSTLSRDCCGQPPESAV